MKLVLSLASTLFVHTIARWEGVGEGSVPLMLNMEELIL